MIVDFETSALEFGLSDFGLVFATSFGLGFAHYDYEIWQMNVKTNFLNGNLEDKVYIIQPEGYTSQEFPDKVCRWQRSIYGLKQASRSWNMGFDEAIRSYEFIKNEDE